MPSKWLLIAVCSLCAAALLIGILCGETANIQPEEPSDAPLGRPYRIIGVWEGRLAVYLPQTDMPEIVYDTPIASLPEEEQQKLREGIAVADSEALAKCLEDYGS